jgi:hypothetical protein
MTSPGSTSDPGLGGQAAADLVIRVVASCLSMDLP